MAKLFYVYFEGVDLNIDEVEILKETEKQYRLADNTSYKRTLNKADIDYPSTHGGYFCNDIEETICKIINKNTQSILEYENKLDLFKKQNINAKAKLNSMYGGD